MRVLKKLLAILGKRAFVTYGLVTLLVAMILAAVNITSRYALKTFVDDQLSRTPWDVAVYQKGAAGETVDAVKAALGRIDGLNRVESMAFLRARFPNEGGVSAEAGGKPLNTPWLSLLAASDPAILPPELSFALQDGRDGAVMALVGPQRAMGPAFLALQGVPDFTVKITVQGETRLLFSTPVKAVVRLDRDELNRWLIDQTGSVSYVPYIGVILLMPFRAEILHRFDSVANGLIPEEMVDSGEDAYGHLQMAEYHPELVFLSRMNRRQLISGWDIEGSLRRVGSLNARIRAATRWLSASNQRVEPHVVLAQEIGGAPALGGEQEQVGGFAVDSTTEVLLARMQRIAQLVGIVSLLIALPLLWMSWVLAANLSGLLMLNERRTLGLLRLRGVEGRLMGRALLIAIVGGGLIGGLLGLVLGSVLPLLAYERGGLPFDALFDARQLWYLGAYLVVSVVLGLLVSRRLVRYAMTISPLEASRRVSTVDATRASLTFGPLQFLALVAGTYALVFAWIIGWRMSNAFPAGPFLWVDRALDFLGLPLFLYGAATFIASKRALVERAVSPFIRPIGGVLGTFAVHHMSVKPHRTAAFLLTVALMTSVSLYPTITSRSFSDKAERGARVQLGTDWQLLFNAPEFVDAARLRGGLEQQLGALEPEVEKFGARLRQVPGVRAVSFMYEAVLPSFYLPGYGLRGVPLYLVGEPASYLQHVYAEPQVGLSDPFAAVLAPLAQGEMAVSPPVADFWRLSKGVSILVGLDSQRKALSTNTSGVVAYLPGIPPRSVSDRQGYVQARIDYLNHLFTSNSYLVSAAHNPKLAGLELLLPRVIALVATDGEESADFPKAVAAALPFPPLEMHSLPEEIGKLGTDMYIALALANMRIYLVGGLILALVAILSIAMVNYREDRRTFALLRIRGTSPSQLRRFFIATLLSPGFLGLTVGALTAVIAGFGLANYVWELREIRSVVQLLPTRLAFSATTGTVLVVLVVLLGVVATAFSSWVYKSTARQGVGG
jgi:hypothetical protein